MRLSQTAEYALRAALHIAEQGGDASIPVAEIAEQLSVPRNYLSKILHKLAKAGVLISARGPGGGFRLRAEPSDMTVAEVIGPVDPITDEQRCLLGRAVCSSAHPCAAHERWSEITVRMSAFFHETTLADLSRPGRLRGA